jgi:8-oxo-dGTP diphosphatase
MSTVDIRSEIHQIVSLMSPLDELERAHIRFVLDWIESGNEIFRIEKPATPDTHLVSYFVIVSPEMDQVLLVDHKKAELWLPPGGHVDPGEDPKETVRREAKEELEIDVKFLCDDPILLTVTKTVGNVVEHTDVSLWYLLKGDPDRILDYDSDEFNHMKRCIQKMQNLKQQFVIQ